MTRRREERVGGLTWPGIIAFHLKLLFCSVFTLLIHVNILHYPTQFGKKAQVLPSKLGTRLFFYLGLFLIYCT